MENGQKDSNNLGMQDNTATRATWKKRKSLNPIFRIFIIGTWGAFLACLISYGMTKIGY